MSYSPTAAKPFFDLLSGWTVATGQGSVCLVDFDAFGGAGAEIENQDGARGGWG